MLDEIGRTERAEPWVREALARGERLMGFGHRVYRTEDPRAALLRETAQELGGPRIALALHVEDVARRLLREAKPDRVLDVNVEYHAAVVLEAVGLPPALFTPTFAVSRAIGWTAHALEQLADNRIVRPSSRYVGPAAPRQLPA
jgi:citrate synthase